VPKVKDVFIQDYIKLFVILESGVIVIFDKQKGTDWKCFLNTKALVSMDFLAFHLLPP
jgi:hypothetical protein